MKRAQDVNSRLESESTTVTLRAIEEMDPEQLVAWPRPILDGVATVPCADTWRGSGSRYESRTNQSNLGGHERPWQTSATEEYGN